MVPGIGLGRCVLGHIQTPAPSTWSSFHLSYLLQGLFSLQVTGCKGPEGPDGAKDSLWGCEHHLERHSGVGMLSGGVSPAPSNNLGYLPLCQFSGLERVHRDSSHVSSLNTGVTGFSMQTLSSSGPSGSEQGWIQSVRGWTVSGGPSG